MRKSESNFSQTTKRKNNITRPRGLKNLSEVAEPDITEGWTADKPTRPGLEKLLPYLNERIAFKMPSDIKYLDGVLDYLNERMLQMGLVKQGDSELLIALDEAIVNAIKHGNKCDPSKAVSIVAELSADSVRFTITDEGSGFSREKVPDPRDPSRLLEPSGRGLLLITHIMDEVRHNRRGNEIRMFKRCSEHCRITDGANNPQEESLE